MNRRIFNCTAEEDDQPLTIHSYISMRKKKIYKNLILSSISQLAMYTMYKTLMMIRQYDHDFLGITSRTTFNAAKMFGFVIISTWVLSRFTPRKIFRWGMLLNSLLIFFHYAKWMQLIIPAATIMGLVTSATWVSQQLYVYRLSKIMSKISGDDLQTVLLRFGGIFFGIYRSYEIVCYLPIAFVPSPSTSSNGSKESCGSGFYFGDYSSLSEFTLPPTNDNSHVASVTLIVLAFCALLLSTFLIDSPHKLTATHLGYENHNCRLSTIIRFFKCRRFQMLIPMSVFAGYEKMFKAYDYTTAYVGCVDSGARAIYVNLMGCIASSQMSLSLVPLVELTSLQIMISLASLVHLFLISVLLFQSHIDPIGYYVISAIWGLASSTWDCLLYVIYGMLSPGNEPESFCHLGFWYSVGASANLILTRYVTVSLKLWTSLVCLLAATSSAMILSYIVNYVPKNMSQVGPMNVDDSGVSGTSATVGQRVSDETRKTVVYFGKTSVTPNHYPPEVKSISTSKIHHVAITRTRPRFDRHEYSNEDVRTLF